MQEDFSLGALQDRILNVMWMRPCGPINQTEETEYQQRLFHVIDLYTLL